MNKPLQNSQPFPFDRVFVIKLRGDGALQPATVAGRIEHLASGERREFDDLAGLHDRIAELLGVNAAVAAAR